MYCACDSRCPHQSFICIWFLNFMFNMDDTIISYHHVMSVTFVKLTHDRLQNNINLVTV